AQRGESGAGRLLPLQQQPRWPGYRRLCHHRRRRRGRRGPGLDRRAVSPPPNHPRRGFSHDETVTMNEPLPWLILFLPLLSAVLITLFTLKNPRFSAILSVGAIFVSLLFFLVVFLCVCRCLRYVICLFFLLSRLSLSLDL